MEENNGKAKEETRELKGYVYKRIIVGVLLAFAGLWIVGTILGYFEPADKNPVSVTSVGNETAVEEHQATGDTRGTMSKPAPATGGEISAVKESSGHEATEPPLTAHASTTAKEQTAQPAETTAPHAPAPVVSEPKPSAPQPTHGASAAGADTKVATVFDREAGQYEPKGVAFINATIKPLEYELTERFYGWRPNDIFDFTDNVNNFQLGVLEVTRRTAVALAERLSRTGSTASFDKNLENAMNWFMIKADRYWFPSPESKYEAGLAELKTYRAKLRKGEARFHTRTDNLIPLLMAFEDLLGSCDENLVKHAEDDGSDVSFFASDDYFFYAKGVASTMHTILEAVQEDFGTTVEGRRGTEVLHHAIESCKEAMEIDPFLILNSSWGSILANHRANIAAPISHARFYMGLLIKTLST